ncbi:hypothetical protein IQ07DRAFT_283982 [Pyrenochaeta sp. DS3sAY3a]|nr:hypothetical protein IQ07DRAFT_283982 [Pyrenochaeta sp. DS3sAY3a]
MRRLLRVHDWTSISGAEMPSFMNGLVAALLIQSTIGTPIASRAPNVSHQPLLIALRLFSFLFIFHLNTFSFTYDHRTLKTELPVRSAVLKQCTGRLVVRWVTTRESLLLYVFDFFFRHFCLG